MPPVKRLTPFIAVAEQIQPLDMNSLVSSGYHSIICNRPDHETEGQPLSCEMQAAAEAVGLEFHYLPVISGKITDEDIDNFRNLLDHIRGPVLAYCKTGTRSTTLWALSEAHHLEPDALLNICQEAGYDLSGLRPRLEYFWQNAPSALPHAPESLPRTPLFDVLVIGGGAAGCAVSASLLRRDPDLRIAIVEPCSQHYYQPGWTLVGAGIFERSSTERAMARCIPNGVQWIQAAASTFEPEKQSVVLDDGSQINYRTLIVCPGLQLNWDAIEGARETLGQNGVTSNYDFQTAPYTWQQVKALHSGRALFTQPPMPIKCAGAPQKAMYLSCDHWLKQGTLSNIKVDFCSAGAVLFGVSDFVPPLMKYVERYNANLNFNEKLIAVDGPAHKAWFQYTQNGQTKTIEREFDFLHLVPPQQAPEFIRQSPLANSDGWVEVEHDTLRHPRFSNIFALGDVCSAPNAKTAAAIRKQAPIVAENVICILNGRSPRAFYDGYGSCPLTVEHGKVLLAEFGYGGKLLPTFPLDPLVPRWLAWKLKVNWMPGIYFNFMLRGREWLAEPKLRGIENSAESSTNSSAACNFKEKK